MRFYCGLDLAQVSDYTASVLVERIAAPEPEPVRYHVRGIHRFPRGTLYPTIVDAMQERLAPLGSAAVLVLDGTGVGRGVVDMFQVSRRQACPVVPVMITAGVRATLEKGYWHVPKRDLVGVIQVLLQTARLKIADVPERATLLGELQTFEVKITPAANATYGAWREGTHDDLVLALALALWHAEQRGRGGSLLQ